MFFSNSDDKMSLKLEKFHPMNQNFHFKKMESFLVIIGLKLKDLCMVKGLLTFDKKQYFDVYFSFNIDHFHKQTTS